MKTRFFSRLIFLLLIGSMLIGQFPLVFAQTQLNSLNQQELQSHAKNLRQLYTNQIDKYRKEERQYTLALTQYQQLNTLSSLEELLQTVVDTNAARADVLITYFELLHDELVLTQGMSLAQKEELSPTVLDMINQLKQQKEQASSVTSIEAANQLAEQFKPLLGSAINLSIRMKFMLDLSQLNMQRQAAGELFSRVKTKQEELPLSEIQRAERGRAYQQIEQIFVSIDQQIADLNSEAMDSSEKYKDQEQKLSGYLTQIETDLLKNLGFIRELANVL